MVEVNNGRDEERRSTTMNNSTIARIIARGIRFSTVAALLTGLLAVTHTASPGRHLRRNNYRFQWGRFPAPGHRRRL